MSDAPGLTKYWTVPGASLLLEEPQPKTFIPRWGLSFASEAVYLASEVEAREQEICQTETRNTGHGDPAEGTFLESAVLVRQVADLTQQLASMTQERDLLNRENHKLREQVEGLECELRSRIDGFLEMAAQWRGVELDSACRTCQGSGTKVYGSTAIWRGGVGGQAMTLGVCDACWGSGNRHHSWVNLRDVAARERASKQHLADLTAQLAAKAQP